MELVHCQAYQVQKDKEPNSCAKKLVAVLSAVAVADLVSLHKA